MRESLMKKFAIVLVLLIYTGIVSEVSVMYGTLSSIIMFGSETGESSIAEYDQLKNDTASLRDCPAIQAPNIPFWLWKLHRLDEPVYFNMTCDPSHKPVQATKKKSSATDGEHIDIIDNLLPKCTQGLVLEMGGLDGKFESESVQLATDLQWKRILIDGDPRFNNQRTLMYPDALGINAVISSKQETVHYTKRKATVDGILEYMSKSFIDMWFKPLLKYKTGTSSAGYYTFDYPKMVKEGIVDEVQTMPLWCIIKMFKIRHIQWFILDVEGGELEVLKTFDFNYTSIDILTVETTPSRRIGGKQYAERIIEMLEPKGFQVLWRQKGRNTWFVRKDFQFPEGAKVPNL